MPRPEQLRRWGDLISIGPVLAGSIAIGALAGRWVDRRFGTAPWGMLVGLALGLAAGTRELLRVLRRSAATRSSRRRPHPPARGSGP